MSNVIITGAGLEEPAPKALSIVIGTSEIHGRTGVTGFLPVYRAQK